MSTITVISSQDAEKWDRYAEGTPDDGAFKVYRDEPIAQTAAQQANLPPKKYQDLKKIALRPGFERQSDARIFYEQGKFMEDFEDDFDYQGEFMRYFPTYQSMTLPQLRGYFSWRTRVRHGTVEKTSLSFVFVHIYELLHGIGSSSPEEGFSALKAFWETYREIDPHINRYLSLWIKDYVVYNNLDKSLLEDVFDADFDSKVLILLNHESYSPEEVFSAINSLSSYSIEKSRFYQQYPEDVKSVVYGVFSELSKYYDRNRKNGLCEKFFGKMYAGSYTMFRSAVFYHHRKWKDFVYDVNGIYRYRCQNGNWSRERFFCYKGKIQKIGVLLKTIDFLMRQKFDFKSSLKVDKTTKIYQDIIIKEIDKLLAGKRKNSRPKIEIDVSKLTDIRKVALETQNKLIVDDWDQSESHDMPVEKPKTDNKTNLNETEYQLMRCMLYDIPYDDLVRSRGQLLSVLIDSINENLFDTFGDTVIVYDGNNAELIDDYIDELKGIIKE